MKKCAIAIVALFVSQKRRAVFGGSVLRPRNGLVLCTIGTRNHHQPEKSIAVCRTIHSRDTASSIDFSRKCHVDADSLVRITAWFGFADDDFVNLAILAKILRATQRLQKLPLIPYCGI